MHPDLSKDQANFYKTERVRNVFANLSMSSATGDGVLFLVAISYFQFGEGVKSLLASSIHYGLILSIFIIPILSRYQWRINRVMPVLLFMAGASLLVASSTDIGALYVCSILIGVFSLMTMTPMVTSLWREQMPAHLRGRLFSQVGIMMMIVNLVFAYGAALYIGDDISRFRPVIVVLAVGLFIAGVFSWLLPNQRLQANKQNPINLLALLWKDKLFGYISMTWMFLGLGNLACLPLRAEYLNDLSYNPDEILLLIAVIPIAGSIFSTLIWGRLFDAMNFIVLRITINAFFVGSLIFFFQESYYLQLLGSICFGIGKGGGNVAWSLWVTKFAPEHRTGDYQMVHAFLTGVRGVCGPLAAYWLLREAGMDSVVWICTAMVATSCFLLIPVIKFGRRGD